ncbi:MAG: mannose-6-phosphate isomerase-like protein (cupin superfamily) [Polaribacter sp.]|jgi:mannose-6-phosphate isomerase-like protein (cupin superfamily)
MKVPNYSPLQLAASLNEFWSPKVISSLDDSYVKVAKLKGEFVWHKHNNEDELFYILKGNLVIEYEDHKVNLTTGDLHIVPKGVMHNPIAEVECLVMLIEKKETLHTGGIQANETKSIEEQLS